MESGKEKFQSDAYKKALARVEALVDNQSFSPIGNYICGDNVLGGFATIDARPCYVYSQYGAVNSMHAKKIAQVYKLAVSMGYPVIGILDSDGLDMEEGMEVLASYGEIFQTISDASGVIPSFSLVYGKCMGTAGLISGLSDFTFALKEANIFIQSPSTASDVKTVGTDNFLTGNYHYTQSGQVGFVFEKEEALVQEFIRFLSFMPSNNLEEAPILLGAEAESCDYLNTANASTELDAEKIVKNISDNGDFIEVFAGYGKGIKTYFARIDGISVLTAVNNGAIEEKGLNKLVRLISFCDSFNIPILTLTDVSEMDSTVSFQKNAISDLARLSYAFANSTVAKINIVMKNAVGLPGLVFNSKFIGADLVYAWPFANMGLFEGDSAKKVLGVDATGFEQAANSGYIDDIIEPAQTRKVVAKAIEALATKRISKSAKKHGSICF